MKKKKIISGLILSLFLILGISVSFFSGTHVAYACYCDPNLAVFPNGHDPSCVNHNYIGNDPTYCGSVSGSVSVSGSSATVPSFTCTTGSVTDFKSLVMSIIAVGCLYFWIVRIIIGFALVFFFWGVFKFVKSGEGGEERKSGKEMIVWGLIGLFVIFSIVALVSILRSTVSLNNTAIVAPKQLN